MPSSFNLVVAPLIESSIDDERDVKRTVPIGSPVAGRTIVKRDFFDIDPGAAEFWMVKIGVLV